MAFASAPAKATPVAAFQRALVEFLRNTNGENGMDDVWNSEDDRKALNGSLYTKAEWKRRGEPYGNDATGGTLVNEGTFCQAMNTGFPRDGDFTFKNTFDAFLTGHGYWYEQGYHYTFHFYVL